MSAWLVTRDDEQFNARTLEELHQLAQAGRLSPGDLVQPPEAADWLYAIELPGMEGLFLEDSEEDDEDRGSGGLKTAVGLLLFAGALGMGYGAFHFWKQIPAHNEFALIGENGFKENEALVATSSAKVYRTEEGKQEIGRLDKDSKLTLLDKRGSLYKTNSSKGEGWVSMYDVAAAYLFSTPEVRELYDTRFNTYRKVVVHNANWGRSKYGSDLSTFRLQLQNTTSLDVYQIKLSAQIRNDAGDTILTKEFPIEGVLAALDTKTVGTLRGAAKGDEPRFMTVEEMEKLKKRSPKLAARWVEEIELPLGDKDVAEATMEVVDARVVEGQ
jgi:hypothetical protein